jgi:hypothetical protein
MNLKFNRQISLPEFLRCHQNVLKEAGIWRELLIVSVQGNVAEKIIETPSPETPSSCGGARATGQRHAKTVRKL